MARRTDLAEGAAAFLTGITQRRVQKQQLKLVQQKQKQDRERKREEFAFMQDAAFENFQREKQFIADLDQSEFEERVLTGQDVRKQPPLTFEQELENELFATEKKFELGERLEPPEEEFFGLTRKEILPHADKFPNEVLDEIFGVDITAPARFGDVQKQRGREIQEILGAGGALSEEDALRAAGLGLGDPFEAQPGPPPTNPFDIFQPLDDTITDDTITDDAPIPIGEAPEPQRDTTTVGDVTVEFSPVEKAQAAEDAAKTVALNDTTGFNPEELGQFKTLAKEQSVLFAQWQSLSDSDKSGSKGDAKLRQLISNEKQVRDLQTGSQKRLAGEEKTKTAIAAKEKTIENAIIDFTPKIGSVVGPSGAKRAFLLRDAKAMAEIFLNRPITQDELKDITRAFFTKQKLVEAAETSAANLNKKFEAGLPEDEEITEPGGGAGSLENLLGL